METELLEKVEMLPSEMQQQVRDFVDSLLVKAHIKVGDQIYEIKAGFGGGKGLIKYMADDFDAPLEEFKDYM